MTPSHTRLAIIAMTIVIVVCLSAAPTWACSVCGGDPESKLGQGALKGVLVLGIIVYTVLIGMSGMFLVWVARARRLAKEQAVQ